MFTILKGFNIIGIVTKICMVTNKKTVK